MISDMQNMVGKDATSPITMEDAASHGRGAQNASQNSSLSGSAQNSHAQNTAQGTTAQSPSQNHLENSQDNSPAEWSKDSWKQYKITQIPPYANKELLHEHLGELETYPPLVFAEEIRSLEAALKRVHKRDAFVLQCGNCAESFRDFNAQKIKNMFKLIMQMAIILTFASGKSIVKIGRIAGQFAKPRSSEFEDVNGEVLLSYFGDMINAAPFNPVAREPDSSRIIRCYQQSASTLNLIRAFAQGGLANLTKIHQFNLDFVKTSPELMHYHALTEDISNAIAFIKACGINIDGLEQLNKSDFYTSHESLFLPYEEALCRIDSLSNLVYDCSAHFLWLGERTRFRGSAHIEFLRGINNPLGIKVGSDDFDTLLDTINTLNPENIEGKITLITRFGLGKIETMLPKLIKVIEENGLNVIYSCDPMHGNTYKVGRSANSMVNEGGTIKTRRFSDIIDEIAAFFAIHKECGTYAGGVHLEISEEDVTECLGGDITEEALSLCYTTQCDPRLNANQSLKLAFMISNLLKNKEIQ